MNDLAGVFNLRRLVELAVPLGPPTSTSKNAHPLGFSLPKRKSYAVTPVAVPLPTYEAGLVQLRQQVGTPVPGIEAHLLDSAWAALLGRPQLIVTLNVTSTQQLYDSGIPIPETVPVHRIRRVGLAAVLAPPEERLQDGFLSGQRLAVAAVLTVQLRPNQDTSADNAWLSTIWTHTTSDLVRQLEPMFEQTTPATISASAISSLYLVVTASRDDIVDEATVHRIESCAGVFGMKVTVLRQATITKGDLSEMLVRRSPRYVLVVGLNDSAMQALLAPYFATTPAAKALFVDREGSHDLIEGTREALQAFVNVSPGLLPIGPAPVQRTARRPRMHVDDPGRCLHDKSNRAYVEDRATGLWWTRDTAHHAGSIFKTYERRERVLYHEACRDADGKVITKWKSDIGATVALADLHACGKPPHTD
jgi:hypothetical protein